MQVAYKFMVCAPCPFHPQSLLSVWVQCRPHLARSCAESTRKTGRLRARAPRTDAMSTRTSASRAAPLAPALGA